MSIKTKVILIAASGVILLAMLGLFLFAQRENEVVVVENQQSVIRDQLSGINDQKSETKEQKTESGDQESVIAGKDEKSSEQDVDAKASQEEKVKEQEKKEESEEKEESQSLASDGTGDDEDELKIKNNLVSWGYAKSNERLIDTIIVHSSYNALGGGEYDVELLIKEYKEYGVSPHYLIDRSGKMYRLVEDKNIAYHAGVSKMPDGREGANAFSIGVELINNKEDEYTKAQYESLNDLIDYLKGKYKIKYVLGHSEVSPGRKTDPWNMDWDKVDR